MEAIDEIDGADTFNLLHDTFHHHLASDPDYFPDNTGLVHVSGVVDASVPVSELLDDHRVLVGEVTLGLAGGATPDVVRYLMVRRAWAPRLSPDGRRVSYNFV